MILHGEIPHIRNHKETAMKMFTKAISLGNVYAYNNIGNLYESEKNYQKAFDNYIISANLGESWACNKIGEFYRTGITIPKDLKKAFDYYTASSESFKFTLCPWSKYNLAKYFYKDGNLELNMKPNLSKAITLLEDVSGQLLEASLELLYIYYELYLQNDEKQTYYFEKLNFYKQLCEKNPLYNNSLKNKIESHLMQIHNQIPSIQIP